MKSEAFKVLSEIEGSWWDFGRQSAISQALKKVSINKKDNVLDLGAGYGSMYSYLSNWGKVDAFEPDKKALGIAINRGYSKGYSSVDGLKELDNTYSLVGAFDVLEHVENDKELVKIVFKLLKPSGTFVVTVPAFQFLWSKHDVSHLHFRRYTMKQMVSLLESNGFELIYSRYWNVILFPLVAVMRILNISGSSGIGSRGVINNLFKFILNLEAWIVRFVPIPFGVSLVVSVRKPSN